MSEIVLLLKIFLNGIFGYYLFCFIAPRDDGPKDGCFSWLYALFSIHSLVVPNDHVVYLFVMGIIWGGFLKLFLKSIDRRLVPNVNVLWFGLCNIFDRFFLNFIFGIFIENSAPNSALLLLVMGFSAVFVDLGLTLRKSI